VLVQDMGALGKIPDPWSVAMSFYFMSAKIAAKGNSATYTAESPSFIMPNCPLVQFDVILSIEIYHDINKFQLVCFSFSNVFICKKLKSYVFKLLDLSGVSFSA
jgi:hypothetical protein